LRSAGLRYYFENVIISIATRWVVVTFTLTKDAMDEMILFFSIYQ